MAGPLKVDIYSHGVRLHGLAPDQFERLRPLIQDLEIRENVSKFDPQQRRVVETVEIKKRFYITTADNTELFVHKHVWPQVKEYLASVGLSNTEEIEIPAYEGYPAKFEIANLVPRDYQQGIIDAIASDTHTTGVKLQTGKGKTFCSQAGMVQRGVRTAVMVLPKYFGLWEKSFKELFEANGYTIGVISGGQSLRNAIDQARSDIASIPDIIIISSVTYRTYIEAYERHGMKGIGELGFQIPPWEFHKTLGIGLQISDEIQDDPGLVYKIDTVTNVKKHVYLSATPYTGNDRLTEMINTMLPKSLDAPIPEIDAYANVVGMFYSDDVRKKDYMGPKGYSQAIYEGKLLKNAKRFNVYKTMVRRVANKFFVSDRKEGQRLLIFCATVAFIEELTDYLKKEFPDLAVNKYVSGVPYSTVLKSDISVTTVKSAGAGVDIPNVRELFLLDSRNSKKDNIQVLGRARKLKDYPGVAPRLTYFACKQIPQHVKYAINKREYFHGRVLTHGLMNYS